jgi:hypothetical protein
MLAYLGTLPLEIHHFSCHDLTKDHGAEKWWDILLVTLEFSLK